ncbi:MAG: LPD29 domain-containing protein [Thermoproteota archaeon]
MTKQFYTPYGWKGAKYEEVENLSLKEIAKIIKRELVSKFPSFKFSVRTEYYAGGRSINIKIVAVPEGFRILKSPKSFEKTEEAQNLIKEIEKIANQYRYVDSDAQIDYFDASFWLSVDFDWELEKRELEQISTC